MSKQKVAVIGATGQFGKPLSINLAKEGAEVLAISRAKTERNTTSLAMLTAAGCQLGYCPDPTDEKALATLLEGCDSVVMVTKATPDKMVAHDSLYLNAAKLAGAKRFIPNEFGAHTLGMRRGLSALFDAKKDMHDKIAEAGLEKTLIYPGLNMDYCLPNFRFWHQITTFGDVDLKLTTHHIDDIGVLSAKIILDERTTGKAVQLYHNRLTQIEMIDLLKKNFPDDDLSVNHISTESILHDMKNGTDEVTGKAGVETDLERAQINYVCYVSGEVTNIENEETLNGSDLYPEFTYRTPEEMLADRAFVFGEDPPEHHA